jgi:hypothetical protein
VCKLHDKFYNENTDTKTRNISDIALAHRADEIARNSIYDDVQRKDAHFIAGIMKAKARLGLGLRKPTKTYALKTSGPASSVRPRVPKKASKN